jgi:hypothetical protein
VPAVGRPTDAEAKAAILRDPDLDVRPAWNDLRLGGAAVRHATCDDRLTMLLLSHPGWSWISAERRRDHSRPDHPYHHRLFGTGTLVALIKCTGL